MDRVPLDYIVSKETSYPLKLADVPIGDGCFISTVGVRVMLDGTAYIYKQTLPTNDSLEVIELFKNTRVYITRESEDTFNVFLITHENKFKAFNTVMLPHILERDYYKVHKIYLPTQPVAAAVTEEPEETMSGLLVAWADLQKYVKEAVGGFLLWDVLMLFVYGLLLVLVLMS